MLPKGGRIGTARDKNRRKKGGGRLRHFVTKRRIKLDLASRGRGTVKGEKAAERVKVRHMFRHGAISKSE